MECYYLVLRRILATIDQHFIRTNKKQPTLDF